jgi:hypothetical protein
MSQKRQVKDVKHALQHNLGLGGCCVVTMYGRNKPDAPGFSRADQTSDPDVLEQIEASEK